MLIAERRESRTRDEVVRRVRREFDEMPGLQLTLAQAERLFGLREDVCRRVLTALVADGVLRQTPASRFARSARRQNS